MACGRRELARQWRDADRVSVGSHTVEFSDVAGWTKPGNQTVTISAGQTATATGIYTPQTSNPVYPAEGTIGTEFTITGSGFGT